MDFINSGAMNRFDKTEGMRATLLVLVPLLTSLALECRGQGRLGTIQLNNRVVGSVDARVTFSDGTPVGAGYTAQLYGGLEGTPISGLQPLVPTTTFRTSTEGKGYLNAVTLEVPGIGVLEKGIFVLRVFDGLSWEESLCRGESNPITIEPAFGSPPPSSLIGLQPFQVNCVPEPSANTLAIVATAVFCLIARQTKRRRRPAPT